MSNLEDKYLTTQNMWITDLPKFIGKPLFAIVHYFKKIKNCIQYLQYIWKNNLCFDMDYLEFLTLLEYKLTRMSQQMEFVGNMRAKSQIKQTLLYLEQYMNADTYVSCPKFMRERSITDLVDINIADDGTISWDNKMSDAEQEEYTKYILNLSDYEQESWDMFWKELNENLVSWG